MPVKLQRGRHGRYIHVFEISELSTGNRIQCGCESVTPWRIHCVFVIDHFFNWELGKQDQNTE